MGFRAVATEPFTSGPNGERILQCHSRGDRRFTPFNCPVTAFGVTASIEAHFQTAKVFQGDRIPCDWRETKRFEKKPAYGGLGLRQTHWRIGSLRPAVRWAPNGAYQLQDLGIQYYVMLWFRYLTRHPELVYALSDFEEFEDPFRGNFPFCQADVLRAVRKNGLRSLRPMFEELTRLLGAADRPK
jgi:hypothetical protein